MKFSIIIPTCNRQPHLARCLELISPNKQTIGSNSYEVIVTDDGTLVDTKIFIEKHYEWVKWVAGPRRGPAANRNNGAKFAQGEWLIFLDDDCLPLANLIEEYNQSITKHQKVVAFEGRIFVDVPQSSFLQESPINETGGLFWSCNICIKTAFFASLNGFDEGFPFPSMEDVEFFKRIRARTSEYKFVYEAAVVHPWRNNNHLFKSILQRQRSYMYYLSKYPNEEAGINLVFYLKVFVRFQKYNVTHLKAFRLRGLYTKFLCDTLQIYFGIRRLLNLDNRTMKLKK